MSGKIDIHTRQAQIIASTRMDSRRSYSSYNITWTIRYRNNNNIYVRKEIIPFVGITILSTHKTWILLKQVQEIISVFGSEFTLMSGFGAMEMWSYGI